MRIARWCDKRGLGIVLALLASACGGGESPRQGPDSDSDGRVVEVPPPAPAGEPAAKAELLRQLAGGVLLIDLAKYVRGADTRAAAAWV